MQHGGPDAHEPRRRRDRDQPGDNARGDAEHRRLLGDVPLGEHPGQRRGRGRGVGDQKGRTGQAVGHQRAAGVEPEPPEPQQRRAQRRQRDAGGEHGFLAVADALAEHHRQHQPRDTGVDVHHRAAGEIQCAHLAIQPLPHTQWAIGQ